MSTINPYVKSIESQFRHYSTSKDTQHDDDRRHGSTFGAMCRVFRANNCRNGAKLREKGGHNRLERVFGLDVDRLGVGARVGGKRFRGEKDAMKEWCMNSIAQPNGAHEIHDLASVKGCLPDVGNRIYLGEFESCHDAIAKGKSHFFQSKRVDGCYHCARECHTEQYNQLLLNKDQLEERAKTLPGMIADAKKEKRYQSIDELQNQLGAVNYLIKIVNERIEEEKKMRRPVGH